MSRKSHNTYEDVNFNTYIYRVLKQVHPDTGMSGDGLSEMNNLIRISLRKIVSAVNQLMMCSKGKKTISSREIQSAVRLSLPGELAKHAVGEGTKAVTKYHSTNAGQRGHPVSRGSRAGLQFPVTRVETIMMELATVNRKGSGAAVYLTACLEYICAELLEIGGNAARDHKKVRITPRHLKLAILNDHELSTFFKGVVMTGGVLPNIHARLLPKVKPVKDVATATEQTPRKKKMHKKAAVPDTPRKKSTKSVKTVTAPRSKTKKPVKKASKAKSRK